MEVFFLKGSENAKGEVNKFLWKRAGSFRIVSMEEGLKCLRSMYSLAFWCKQQFSDFLDKCEENNSLIEVEAAMKELLKVTASTKKDTKTTKSGKSNKKKNNANNNNNESVKKHLFGVGVSHLCQQFIRGMPVVRRSSTRGDVLEPYPYPLHFSGVYKGNNAWIKVFDSEHFEEGENESAVLKDLGGRICPELLTKVYLGEEEGLAVIMSYSGKDLKSVKAEDLMQVCLDALVVLSNFHGKGYLHGDIKESNFCVNEDGIVRLIDCEHAVKDGNIPCGEFCYCNFIF